MQQYPKDKLKYHDPQIYIEKLGESKTGHEVWQVNGEYIQIYLDINFSNFAQPLDEGKDYIPKDEFWMDIESSPDEYAAFLIHMETEWKLQNKGVPWDKAHQLALREERKYRDKHRSGKAKGPYLKKIGKFEDAAVWLVDGKFVRDWYDTDFTEGGHGYVYDPWIPFDEIWIDNDTLEDERKFDIVHEGVERRILKKLGESEHEVREKAYSAAHEKASQAELKLRKAAWKKKEEKELDGLEIVEPVRDLFQSTYYTKKEIPILKELQIDAIVDLIGMDIEQIPGIDMIKVPFEDEEKLPENIEELWKVAENVFKRWVVGEKILVHCHSGINRSSLFIGMILHLAGLNGEDIVKKIKKTRSEALNNKVYKHYLEGL